MKVAIIGAGNVAETVHIPVYKNYSGITLDAICDLNLQLAKEVAEKYQIPHYFDDVEKMLKTIQPDIVSICVPNKFHSALTIASLKQGAHVFCEKPPALTLREAQLMHETAMQFNKKLAYNFHHRYRPEITILENWIKLNPDVYHIEVHAVRQSGIPGWGSFTNREIQGGGALIDLGIHMLDLALYLMNYPKPKTVLATMNDAIGKLGGTGKFGPWSGKNFTVEDACFAHIVFEGNRSIQLKTTFALHTDQDVMNLTFYAPKSGMSLNPLKEYNSLNEPMTLFYQSEIFNHKALLSFIDELVKNETICKTLSKTVLLTQEIIEGVYQSAKTSKPFVFEDVKNVSF